MTLQNKTIQRYRLFFPEETLREVSARTGIQITRVFRLFNGKAMKLGEFEAFEKAIHQKMSLNPNYSRLGLLAEEASSLLSTTEITKIVDYIERKITNKKFASTYYPMVSDDASIA
jgi:hypothetical protein